MKKLLATIFLPALLMSCATQPDKIKATTISPDTYADFDCNQVRQEILRVHERVSSIAGMQRTKAKSDAMAVGVGLVLYWPALFLVAGGDMDEEIASLKGQYEALSVTAEDKNCPVATELGLRKTN